ncbi:hypothetical protein BD413DRAFT_647260 [Trametes elegans]|nr:hypothetical protein BD413DRAFT_647260 [Trametes elegans]
MGKKEKQGATDPEKRFRAIGLMWERDPDGPVLEKDKAPVGYRVPNGLVWGHALDELFLIPRVPSVPAYVTVYSRSMLKILGEHYDETEAAGIWDRPLVPPRIRRPWPVLKLPIDHPSQPEPPLGAIDEGCFLEHSGFGCWAIRADGSDYKDVDEALAVAIRRPRRCPADASTECTGRIVPNDAGLKDSHGQAYTYLWCTHFKQLLGEKDANAERMIAEALVSMTQERVIADSKGVRFMGFPPWPMQDFHLHVGSDGGASSAASAGTSTNGSQVVVKAENADVEMKEASEESNATTAETEDIDMSSTEGLPKLEEFIPDPFLPDTLMVHDPDRTTNYQGSPNEPIKYRRVTYSRPGPTGGKVTIEVVEPQAEEQVAHLYLRNKNELGQGHHSFVTVAAKLAVARCGPHRLLHNEARTYAHLPKHVQEEYCGLNIVPPCRFPVLIGPVVPKYYGFYLPVDQDGQIVDTSRDGKHNQCYSCGVDWLSPILLMEECGDPVKPEKFTVDQRTECFSLVLRLHELNVAQNSFYLRNIMIQPGPLDLPPAQRSFARPSFRIIDLGRATCLAVKLAEIGTEDKAARRRAISSVHQELWDEEKLAREELLIQEHSF